MSMTTVNVSLKKVEALISSALASAEYFDQLDKPSAARALRKEAEALQAAIAQPAEPSALACHDCHLPYSDPGFADFVVPDHVWKQISPTGHEGGILCAPCMFRRLVAKGIECDGRFTSGPCAQSDWKKPEQQAGDVGRDEMCADTLAERFCDANCSWREHHWDCPLVAAIDHAKNGAEKSKRQYKAASNQAEKLVEFLSCGDLSWEPDADKFFAVLDSTTQILSISRRSENRKRLGMWDQHIRMELLRRAYRTPRTDEATTPPQEPVAFQYTARLVRDLVKLVAEKVEWAEENAKRVESWSDSSSRIDDAYAERNVLQLIQRKLNRISDRLSKHMAPPTNDEAVSEPPATETLEDAARRRLIEALRPLAKARVETVAGVGKESVIGPLSLYDARRARGLLRELGEWPDPVRGALTNDEAIRLLRSIRNRLRGGNETGAAIVDEIDDFFLTTHGFGVFETGEQAR